MSVTKMIVGSINVKVNSLASRVIESAINLIASPCGLVFGRD